VIQASLGKKQDSSSKITRAKRVGVVDEAVQKTLISNPGTAK
jgi:hypothetical protein